MYACMSCSGEQWGSKGCRKEASWSQACREEEELPDVYLMSHQPLAGGPQRQGGGHSDAGRR